MASLRRPGRCPFPPPSPRSWRERRRSRSPRPQSAGRRNPKAGRGKNARRRTNARRSKSARRRTCVAAWTPAGRTACPSPRPQRRTRHPFPGSPRARASRPLSATRGGPGGQSASDGLFRKKTGVETRPAVSAEPISCRPSDWSASPTANPAMSAAIPAGIKRIPTLIKNPPALARSPWPVGRHTAFPVFNRRKQKIAARIVRRQSFLRLEQDPVRLGLVASLARPGGTQPVSTFSPERAETALQGG